MANRRQKNVAWAVLDENGRQYTGDYGAAQLAVLMDLRDEIQKLNQLLHCRNFTDIPKMLRSIQRSTYKPRAPKK